MTHRSTHPLLRRTLLYAALIAIGIAYSLPLIWMASTSIKPEAQTVERSINFLPTPASQTFSIAADNYSRVWRDPTVNFPLYLRNTLIIAALSVIGMVLSSAIVAFALARLQWRGRGTVFAIILATMMIPFPVLMVPLYLVFRELGWIGTLKPLWIPAWFGGAFNIFLLRQFFMSIPRELDEAARIDGCSTWGIFWRVILPLSKPALGVVALFHFIFVWNDFLAPLVFLSDRDQFTLALGLQLYQSQAGNTPWNLLMAASTLVILPVLIVFLFAQKAFVQGIATQGIKE